MIPAASELRLFDDSDAGWIGSLLDVVERSLGEPWRVLLERVELGLAGRAHASRVKAVVGALRRVSGGRAERARVARKVRSLVLGNPALDRDARDIRLAAAGCQLGLAPADVEGLLWADLAKERPVTLPLGRPAASELVAFANLDRIQHAVRRAHDIRLRVWGDAHDLVRTVTRYGLLARISRGDEGETRLDVTGPLALFHATTIYGRALTALVPLLAEQTRFTLDVRCDFGGVERWLHVEPPVLLPPVFAPRHRGPSVAEQLVRDLGAAELAVERDPPPIASGTQLLFPDLAIEHAGIRWLVEIVGFSTAEYLDHKLASYRAAGVEHVLLCVDSARSKEPTATARNLLWFRRRIDAPEIIEALR